FKTQFLNRSKKVSYDLKPAREIERGGYSLSPFQSKIVFLKKLELVEQSDLPSHRKLRAVAYLIGTHLDIFNKQDIEVRVPLERVLLACGQGSETYDIQKLISSGVAQGRRTGDSVEVTLGTRLVENVTLARVSENLVKVNSWWRNYFELSARSN